MTQTEIEAAKKAGRLGKCWVESSVENSRPMFEIGERKFEFVDYWPDLKKVRAWLKTNNMGTHQDYLGMIPLNRIPVEILKNLPVWAVLSPIEQDELTKSSATMELIEQQNVAERMEKARRGRKGDPELVGIPRELTCTNPNCGSCKKTIKVNPRMVIKQAARKQQTVVEYVAAWKCPECEPRRRGKAPSAKWLNAPRELVCKKCGKVQPQHPSMTEKQADAAGKKFTEFVDTWLCIKCRPEGDKRRRGRAPNPLFAGIPKTVHCTGCKKEVTVVAAQFLAKAKILKMTVEELVKNFKCRSCGGRLPRQKKNKKGKGKR